MNKKNNISKDKDIPDESYIRKTTIVEEYIDMDNSLIELENNNDLIRLEMNIIEFPIFSRSRKLKTDQIKKYYFNSKKDSYLEVTPGNKETIPGELEERVFIALLKIFKEKGYQQTFYCTMSDILDCLNIAQKSRSVFYSRIRSSMNRLASTNYKFKNLFYSSELNKPVDDLINTNILTYRAIKFTDASDDEIDYFSDKRIKEVYKIMLSGHFYENIVRKGYLVFEADELLNIKDSVTRSIYTMITKWRNRELYLRRPAFYIARRIPLSWGTYNTRKTISKINDSLNELKTLGYISDYKQIKGKKIDATEFEMSFCEEHNKLKQLSFYEEKTDYNNIIHLIEERQNNDFFDVDGNISEIINSFGPKGTSLKTLPNLVKEVLKTYDFDYVKYTAEYTILNSKASILKYFKEALANNWADEYIAKKKSKEVHKIEKKTEIIEEAVVVEDKKHTFSWDDFEKLSLSEQKNLTEKAYEKFLIDSGGIDSHINRSIFEKTKKGLILSLEGHYLKKDEPTQDLFEMLENLPVSSEPIETSIPTYSDVDDYLDKNERTVHGEPYPSMASFCMTFYKEAKKVDSEISLEDIITSIKLLGEYDDENFLAKYDIESNHGGYKSKK